MEDVDRQLLELVRGRAGDAFRGALRYDADSYTVLYAREDVKTEELREAIPTAVQRAREHEPVLPEELYAGFGPTHATVELHEHAALIHFSPEETGQWGLLVSLDRDVAQGLSSFVENCLAVFEE